MKKERLLELAGIKLKEDVDLARLDPTDYHSDEVANFVAEHIWHTFQSDAGANKMFERIKTRLAELRKLTA